MTLGPAMTPDEALRAIAIGLELVDTGALSDADVVGLGEMGIGNTTAASAITAVMTGAPPEAVTGRGTGVDDAGRRRKVAAIERAIAVNRPDAADPLGVLAAVGGLEIALLVGVIVGAAAARRPVVLDGFITGAAALIAVGLEPLDRAAPDRLAPLGRAGTRDRARTARPPAAARPRPAARGGERRGPRDEPARRGRPGPRRHGDLRVRGRRRSRRRSAVLTG